MPSVRVGTFTGDFVAVEKALYNLILTAVKSVFPMPFVFETRTPQPPQNVDPSMQPWFALCGLGGVFINNQAPGLMVYNPKYLVQILTRADGTPYDPKSQTAPQDLMNQSLQAIIGAILLPFGQKQTLGMSGFVIETLLEETKMNPGILDPQCSLELIVSTKLGINGN